MASHSVASLLSPHMTFYVRMLSEVVDEMVLLFCIIGIPQAWHLLIPIDQAGFFQDVTVQKHCFPIGRFSSFLLKHIPLHPVT